ncbi:condensation domain-containing protein [Entomohabitans teleogrylli]|uniref:condensation domain-containing protein n=1 Tax=Entomohabitans teleogrylli TaxID=1384589 RepID=UPI00073D2460|nr:condensation domain-containing protein [Entomohabitans teleogrylli]
MNANSQQNSVLRLLGPLERYAWLIDPISPKHFTITAEVSGPTTIETWEAAFKAIQSRHPLTNAQISSDDEQTLHFVYDPSVKIPMRVVLLDRIADIESEIKREFSAPFGIGDIPLLRAALLYSKERCIVILTSHHSISDGLSLSHFLRDLLECLSGKSLPPLVLKPTVADICINGTRPVTDKRIAQEIENPIPYTERSLARLSIHRKKLSLELSGKLRERAKQEGTTVHGALSSAFAFAFDDSVKREQKKVRICTPIDARRFFELDYDMSFSVVFPTNTYDMRATTSFWDVARAVTGDLQSVRTQEGISALLNHFHDFMNSAQIAQLIDFDRINCAPDILISNLGVLPFPASFGDLKIESVWGPNVLIGTHGEQTIGVATINNAIHLIHTSYQPIDNFLDIAEEQLISSVR